MPPSLPDPAELPPCFGQESERSPALEAVMLISLIRLQAALAPQSRPLPRRLWEGVSSHFVVRAPEWWATFFLLQFGWILYSPPDVFEFSPNLAVIASWFSETTWGALCLGVGAIHLFALIVNGTFPRFPWSPHLRALASFAACGLWGLIAFGIFLSGIGGTGLGTYRLMFLLEAWNFMRACRDTGKVEGRRGGNG